MGNSLTVELPTLTRAVLVRIQVPQPARHQAARPMTAGQRPHAAASAGRRDSRTELNADGGRRRPAGHRRDGGATRRGGDAPPPHAGDALPRGAGAPPSDAAARPRGADAPPSGCARVPAPPNGDAPRHCATGALHAGRRATGARRAGRRPGAASGPMPGPRSLAGPGPVPMPAAAPERSRRRAEQRHQDARSKATSATRSCSTLPSFAGSKRPVRQPKLAPIHPHTGHEGRIWADGMSQKGQAGVPKAVSSRPAGCRAPA